MELLLITMSTTTTIKSRTTKARKEELTKDSSSMANNPIISKSQLPKRTRMIMGTNRISRSRTYRIGGTSQKYLTDGSRNLSHRLTGLSHQFKQLLQPAATTSGE